MIVLESTSYTFCDEAISISHYALMAKINRRVNCTEVGFTGEWFSKLPVFSPLGSCRHFLCSTRPHVCLEVSLTCQGSDRPSSELLFCSQHAPNLKHIHYTEIICLDMPLLPDIWLSISFRLFQLCLGFWDPINFFFLYNIIYNYVSSYVHFMKKKICQFQDILFWRKKYSTYVDKLEVIIK